MQGLKINNLREDLKIKNFCSSNDTIEWKNKLQIGQDICNIFNCWWISIQTMWSIPYELLRKRKTDQLKSSQRMERMKKWRKNHKGSLEKGWASSTKIGCVHMQWHNTSTPTYIFKGSVLQTVGYDTLI